MLVVLATARLVFLFTTAAEEVVSGQTLLLDTASRIGED